MGWGVDGVISLDVVIFGYIRWGFWDGFGRMVIILYRVFVVIPGCRFSSLMTDDVEGQKQCVNTLSK